MSIFRKIKDTVKNRKTYRAGLLQAKVYRALKSHTQENLAPYNISTIDWALLGLLFDNPEGLRPSVLAEMLGVESPFVTVLLANLKKMNLVDVKNQEGDNRVKIFFLTQKGVNLIPEIENHLRSEMKILIRGIHHTDLVTYLSVLEKISENSASIKVGKMKSLKD